MKRILIADDHPIVRRGYRALIDQESDMQVCCETANASEALSLVSTLKPDMVITDLVLAGINGLELVKQLKELRPDLPVLVVSMHDESLYAERSIAAGARGYLMKSAADTQVIEAIRKIMKGGFYLSDFIAQRLIARTAGGQQPRTSSAAETLSDRELEVFILIGQGHSTAQIAEQMKLSPKTVDTYRQRIREKLVIESSSELVRQAVLWVEGRML